MTTKPKATRFRITRPVAPPPAGPAATPDDAALFEPAEDGFGDGAFPTARGEGTATPAAGSVEAELAQIAAEGLTGRQLRVARRLAGRHGITAASDLDAVRLLRKNGIDPFRRGAVLEVVGAAGETPAKPEATDAPAHPPSRALTAVPDAPVPRLPPETRPLIAPTPLQRAEEAQIAEIGRIQQDLARRRRRRMRMLAARLFLFVALPTILAGIYYYVIATPLYSTRSEFVIQMADGAVTAGGPAGITGMLGGALEANKDAIAVQGYLQSREAMLRLDADQGFRAHFSDPGIDPVQRLPDDASVEDAYRLFKTNVKIAFDPTEGIIKMDVRATSPAMSEAFSKALIGYAEEQIDHLTQRKREDQMRDARLSHEGAEKAMAAAQRKVVELQEKFRVLSSDVEVSLITAQIGQLEGQLSQDRLSLAQMESNATPNPARVDPLKRRIATIEGQIADLRSKLTEGSEGSASLATVQSELLMAQADVQTRQLMLATTLQQLETARIEANRQVRYLSLSVRPVAPDEPTYPRAFENTLVALLLFLGIYLMISMTVAILREQLST